MAFAVILVFFVVAGGRCVLDELAGAAVRCCAHADRRARPRDGPGRDPARQPFADRPQATRSTHTFGLYRLEILAAFVNSLLLFGVAIWVVVEAIRRLGDEPEVLGGPMLVVAVLGLIANLVAFVLLREGASESVNVEGAYLEVLADTVGSVGVIVAAVLAAGVRLDLGRLGRRCGDRAVDPAAHVAARTQGGAHPAAGGARRIRPRPARRSISDRSTGVVDVHDLHVWTLTSEMDAASAHLVTSVGADSHAVLDRAAAVPRRDLRRHARNVPGRARRPRGVRPGHLVTPAHGPDEGGSHRLGPARIEPVKAAILVESLTGNTWHAAEKVADLLAQERWSITGLSKVKQPDYGSIQEADLDPRRDVGPRGVRVRPGAVGDVEHRQPPGDARQACGRVLYVRARSGQGARQTRPGARRHRRLRHRRHGPQPQQARPAQRRSSPSACSTPSPCS